MSMTQEQALKLLEHPIYKWSMDWDEREDGLDYTEAIEIAIAALRHQIWEEQLWHDAKTDPPSTPCLWSGAGSVPITKSAMSGKTESECCVKSTTIHT